MINRPGSSARRASKLRRAFVTGASGFIGGSLTRLLMQEGWTVRALVRPDADTRGLDGLDGERPGLLPVPGEPGAGGDSGALERVVGDLAGDDDGDGLARSLEGCELLFHVAARYRLWNPRPAEIYRDNVEGTRRILAAARRAGVRRVVHTSTVGTLALVPGRASVEGDTLSLESLHGHYKRSKWLAEEAARQAAAEGLDLVIVLPTAPIGPGDLKPTPTGAMVLEFLRGKVHAYVDTGLNVVGVEDCAMGHLLAAERGHCGESYIVGGEDLTLLAVYRLLGELSGHAPPRLRLPLGALRPLSVCGEALARFTGRPPLVPREALEMAGRRMHFDHSKAARELGYHPGPARVALARAALWFYLNGYVQPRRSEAVERLERLCRESAAACAAAT